jgi:hypothetical protein
MGNGVTQMVDVVSNTDPTLFYMPSFFDYNLIIPVWLWIILIMIFLGFVALVAMIYVWYVLRPVAGYGSVGDTSTAKGSPTQVFSIWKNRSFVIECMWYYGNVLAYANPLNQMQMWFHNSEKATGTSAGKSVMIVRDGFDGTVDFIAEMAMCELPKRFNEDWGFEVVPALDIDKKLIFDPLFDADGNPICDETGVQVQRQRFKEVERKDENDKPYLLKSFVDIRYRMSTLQKLYPVVEIPIYKPYDLSEIYQWTPRNQDSLKHGVDNVEEAREWAKDDERPAPGLIDKYGLVIVCALVGFFSTGFVWYIFPITGAGH